MAETTETGKTGVTTVTQYAIVRIEDNPDTGAQDWTVVVEDVTEEEVARACYERSQGLEVPTFWLKLAKRAKVMPD